MNFISSAELGTFKQDSCVNLHQICDNCTYVNLTSITYPNSTLQKVNEVMTKDGVDYNYTFCTTSDFGNYLYNVCGDQDGTLTCENLGFTILNKIISLEVGEAIIYVLISFLVIGLFSFFLYFALTLPYENDIRNDGKGNFITSISKSKYFKILSAWLAFGFFMWFLQILAGLSNTFVSLNTLSNFITNIFLYAGRLSYVVTIFVLILIFYNAWRDILWSKTIRQYGKAFIDGRLK